MAADHGCLEIFICQKRWIMRLALVFNPFSYVVHEENLRIVQRFFGLFPPLSLAWVASVAEKHGHEVIIIDARTLGLSMQETVKILKDFRPDVVGFTITSYVYQEILSWIRYIKKCPFCKEFIKRAAVVCPNCQRDQ